MPLQNDKWNISDTMTSQALIMRDRDRSLRAARERIFVKFCEELSERMGIGEFMHFVTQSGLIDENFTVIVSTIRNLGHFILSCSADTGKRLC